MIGTPDNPVMIPLTEILQNVTGSCDFWSLEDEVGMSEDEARTALLTEIILLKSADTGFGHLVESIMEHGFTGSAIGYDREECFIHEGHHRLVAAILLGLDEVPVTTYGKNGSHTTPTGGIFSAHNRNDDPYPIQIEVAA